MFKKLLLAIMLTAVFLTVPAAKAQTKVLIGSTAGSSFSNLFVSADVKLEQPFAKRYEFDVLEQFIPIEEHIGLGSGFANYASTGMYFNVTNHFGFNSFYDYSSYSVRSGSKTTSKASQYVSSGVTFMYAPGHVGSRFSLDYNRQLVFGRGIDAGGVEAARLQGGEFKIENRLACYTHGCLRIESNFEVGRVLTQSNPVCDGTFGITGGNGPNGTCYRKGANSGSFTMGIYWEFSHNHNREII